MSEEKEPVEVKLVFPMPEHDAVSDGLRLLTFAIHEQKLADGDAGGIFGGAFGYGANYDNDTFMLHRYCWCEKESCSWCGGYAPHFRHKASGTEIRWYKYIGRDMEGEIKAPWGDVLKECLASIGVELGEPLIESFAKTMEADAEAFNAALRAAGVTIR